MKIKTIYKSKLADTKTPVGLYLGLRDKFSCSLLLESTDYHDQQNAKSILCFEPLATFKLEQNEICIDGQGMNERIKVSEKGQVQETLQRFIGQFEMEQELIPTNGVYGYTSFESVKYFDSVNLEDKKTSSDVPIMVYSLYRYMIEINHFNDELTLIENVVDGESKMAQFEQFMQQSEVPKYSFTNVDKENSNINNEEFKQLVSKAKSHCQLGDVFQLVLSRQFAQQFSGDEFNVYRALRSVNPSPYLYFFDFGSYKMFGSSPEAQLKVQKGKAIINPIAGTFKRTGNDLSDRKAALDLVNDPKENAEHNMLVDLARNDLSKHGTNVKVTSLKQVQFYSHVIHLVSEVEAEIDMSKSIYLFADTFPAGTLSGAPKFKAIELINSYEDQNRGFYGGAIGYFGLDGSVNHAICIRSFLSKQNTLYYQAGAGVVVDSNEESELQEVNNKLGALKLALSKAEQIN